MFFFLTPGQRLWEEENFDSSSSKLILSLIVNAFWCLWLNRNEIRFHSRRVSPSILVERALASNPCPYPKGISNFNSLDPNLGSGAFDYIMQCDDLFSSPELIAGIGFCLLSLPKSITIMGSFPCKAYNPLMAEALAILKELQHAQELQIIDLKEIQSDSQSEKPLGVLESHNCQY